MRQAWTGFVTTIFRFLNPGKSANGSVSHPVEMQIGEVAWVRYWVHHKQPPYGWVHVPVLEGTHHGEHAKLIRMVK
jgi:hypothetical protein